MGKAIAADPAIGIWKLNLVKSGFALAPAPKSSMIKVEARGDGLKVTADTVNATGNRLQPEIVYKFDGKDYPLTGSPLVDSISARRVSECRAESIWKKRGLVVLSVRAIISYDLKTLTVMRTGLDAQGRTADEVLVYERQ
jgi:hypothetical protein